jgi:hypothetical protein
VGDEQINADFERARTKAFLRDVLSLFRRQPNTLIPYSDIRQRLTLEGESYRGLREVPVSQIIGSVDRFRDFDRRFLPRQRHTADRWKSVDRAYHQDVRLPPIQLYKVGDVYFVKDGNHRVSVAREHGVEFIDAEVIEGHIRTPLDPSMSSRQLLQQAEYAEFLRKTNLDRSKPEHDIRPTSLGRYDEMIAHIEGRRSLKQRQAGREISLYEAATDWYDNVYLPIALAARDQNLLRDFPDKTEADIYLWVMANRLQIQQMVGFRPDPEVSTQVFRSVEGRKQPIRRFGLRLRARLRELTSGLLRRTRR